MLRASGLWVLPLCILAAIATPRPGGAVCVVPYGPSHNAATAGPTDMAAAGDFNEDGNLDIVVANGYDNEYCVLLGSGLGTFGPPACYPFGGYCHFIAVADFNEDGILDLAAVGSWPGKVGIALGTGAAPVGDGGFAALSNYAVGDNPTCVQVADFNEDGIHDLVVSNSSSNTVSVLIGQGTNGTGNGTFGAPVSYPAGEGPVRIAVADFNEDGIHDLAISNNNFTSSTVSVLIGQGVNGVGDGTFAPQVQYPTGRGPWGIAAADLDEDGILDLVVACVMADSIRVLRGLGEHGIGDGTFRPRASYYIGDAPYDLVVGDFFGDGCADLAACCLEENLLVTMKAVGSDGVGSGVYDPSWVSRYPVGLEPIGVMTADFDNDGRTDLLASSSGSAQVMCVELACPELYPTGFAVPSELTETGFVVHGERTISFARGTGGIHSRVAVSYDNRASWQDIVFHATATTQWNIAPPKTSGLWLRFYDPTVLANRFDIGPAPVCEAIGSPSTAGAITGNDHIERGDFNGDGVIDIAYASSTTGELRIMIGVGNGSFTGTTQYTLGSQVRGMVVDDFNDDGIQDLAVSHFATFGLLRGNGAGGVGDGTFAAEVFFPTGSPSPDGRGLVAGDFNEDGVVDVAMADQGSETVYVSLGLGANGNGIGSFGAPVAYPALGDAIVVETTDLDEDGITDLLVTLHSVDGRGVAFLRGLGSGGRGNGTFAPAVRFESNGAAQGVAVGDFNSDSVLDLAVANSTAGQFSVLLGQGPGDVWMGAFAPPVAYPVGAGCGDLAIVDVDADGIEDLLTTSDGHLGVHRGQGVSARGDGTFRLLDDNASNGQIGDFVTGDFNQDNAFDMIAVVPDYNRAVRELGQCVRIDPAGVLYTGPDGGSWPLGATLNVTWYKDPRIPLVDVEISRNGGPFTPIARRLIGTAFAWTVTPPLGSARLRVRDSVGGLRSSNGPSFGVVSPPVEVGSSPTTAAFGPPSPNPFLAGGSTTFALELPRAASVRVDVFNLAGRRIATVHDRVLPAGTHHIRWDGRDARGLEVGTGMYFVRAAWEGTTRSQSVLRLR